MCNIKVAVRGHSQTLFTRGGGRWYKKLTFCQKMSTEGVGGEKSQNIFKIVCEHPLSLEKKSVLTITHFCFLTEPVAYDWIFI